MRWDRTYVFTDHYVAVVQLVCVRVDIEPQGANKSAGVNVQLARIDLMVFSSVLVNGTVLLI